MIRYRPTATGGWEATCTRCDTDSPPYPAKSMARDWGRTHECRADAGQEGTRS